ncbi:hypothetical protein SAMN05443639_105163 [Stigmatella erecta]|uniref:Uncharacterized protein n=2 Tax=Stigmatella erecta TaxID=83460 RepID=A0A1I0HWN7_9BACT|nr:hypothetical protein SAMN05443639_105163 [Stigmatella erecta]
MAALGLFTLIAGGRGFVTGFVACLRSQVGMEAARPPTLLAFGRYAAA